MDAKRTTDREWIQSAVSQFEGPLTIYAARLLGDVDRARDVVQDTFLKLWQAERATVDGHLAKWLYTVCRNRALDVRRKEHRMTRLDQTEAPAAPAAGDSPGKDCTGVLALVAGLPDRQQEAVRLKFQGGLSYREIAEVMNTTANNVGVLLHTAIKSIREQLAATPSESTTR
jgi:RNA polymerase sigma-70 factor (ECF subfamily)